MSSDIEANSARKNLAGDRIRATYVSGRLQAPLLDAIADLIAVNTQ